MQRQLFLFLLPCIIDGTPRIIGGRSIKITDVPYQLSLRRHGHHVCGASVLNTSVAVTAAHCLQVPGAYSVKAGASALKEPGVVVHVNVALIHPSYNKALNDNDIALLFLESPLTLTDKIRPVGLPGRRDRAGPGMVGRVSGWGVTAPGSSDQYSDELRAVDLPVVGWHKCSLIYYYRLTERMFCAGLPEGRKDSCSGDSGGPFVSEGVLYGIVSSGVDCAQPGYPGIYSNVQALRGFIREYAGF